MSCQLQNVVLVLSFRMLIQIYWAQGVNDKKMA